jgi:hypothetical protein
MDRALTSQEQADYLRWLGSSSLSTHQPNDELLIAYKLARRLQRPPTNVIRASRGQNGQDPDLVVAVEEAVAADPDIEHWRDGRVRRLRFAVRRGWARPDL